MCDAVNAAPAVGVETVVEFPSEVVLDPATFGEWHPIGDGIEVRVSALDTPGTLRVRRRREVVAD